MRFSQRKERDIHLRNFIDFLEIHNPFKASSSDLINIATGTIASSDVNVDSSIDVRNIAKSGQQIIVQNHTQDKGPSSNIRNYEENCRSWRKEN